MYNVQLTLYILFWFLYPIFKKCTNEMKISVSVLDSIRQVPKINNLCGKSLKYKYSLDGHMRLQTGQAYKYSHWRKALDLPAVW